MLKRSFTTIIVVAGCFLGSVSAETTLDVQLKKRTVRVKCTKVDSASNRTIEHNVKECRIKKDRSACQELRNLGCKVKRKKR